MFGSGRTGDIVIATSLAERLQSRLTIRVNWKEVDVSGLRAVDARQNCWRSRSTKARGWKKVGERSGQGGSSKHESYLQYLINTRWWRFPTINTPERRTGTWGRPTHRYAGCHGRVATTNTAADILFPHSALRLFSVPSLYPYHSKTAIYDLFNCHRRIKWTRKQINEQRRKKRETKD